MEWYLLGAGLLSLIGGLWQTSINNKNQKILAEETAEKNKNDSIEIWNMQNEYNTPQAQMNRYKSAGLNPNLIYTQGNTTNMANYAGQEVPKYSPYQADLEQFQQAIGLGQIKQQIESTQLDNALKKSTLESNIIKNQAEATKLKVQADWIEKFNNQRYNLGQYQNAIQDNTVKRLGIENKFKDQQISRYQEESENLLLKWQMENEMRKAGINPNQPKDWITPLFNILDKKTNWLNWLKN